MKANAATRAAARLIDKVIVPVCLRRPPDFAIGPAADPRMLRWWVIPRNRWFNVYLHCIRHDDDDRALHDHPWPNLTIVLATGYREHTPGGVFDRGVGDLVFRRATEAHRLEMLPSGDARPRGAWSLFLTGPVVRTWGFYCPQGWVPWRQFVEPDRPGEIGRGCGEQT